MQRLHAGELTLCPAANAGSLRLDVGRPDHLGPHFDFGRDAGRELLRRARDQVVAEHGEPLLHVRLCEDFAALTVKDRDNLCGGPGDGDVLADNVAALLETLLERGQLCRERRAERIRRKTDRVDPS
jgi:hypothetical protein